MNKFEIESQALAIRLVADYEGQFYGGELRTSAYRRWHIVLGQHLKLPDPKRLFKVN
ncbi:MAG: hypothetical protein Q7U37_08060 [Gallionella sp.]|nr:hypothetical protein [Gallionella sp.]